MQNKKDILNLDLPQLQEVFQELGLKKFNATQVYEWLHKKMEFDFYRFTNISKKDQIIIDNNFFVPKFKIVDHLISKEDKTEKFLFELEDKSMIETVLIGHNNRYTLCISSQIGCLLGCTFCATATMKYERNLTVSEILMQFYNVEKTLNLNNKKIDNVVFMGMGEPFLNYNNVINSINILHSDKGAFFSKRSFTISTSGLIKEIKKLARDEKQVNLAISLHSIKDSIRSEIMPINKKYPLDKLKKALIEYQIQTKNRITFEYILIDDLNCDKSFAFDLVKFLKQFSCLLNLIPYNPVIGKDYKTPSKAKQREFYNILKTNGINVTLRESKGQDIAAACGQLKAKKEMI